MIAHDMRESCGAPGTIVLIIDQLVQRDALPTPLKHLIGHFQPTKTFTLDMEYFLLEDEPMITPIRLLIKRTEDVYFYREAARTADHTLPEDRHFVNVILNCKTTKVSISKFNSQL